MIQKESWHKEALSMEGELAKLKKLLFQGAISEIEFAKAVMRMHPGFTGENPEGSLLKGSHDDLFVSERWYEENSELQNELLDLVKRVKRVLMSHAEDERLLSFLGWEISDHRNALYILGSIQHMLTNSGSPRQAEMFEVSDPSNWSLQGPAVSEKQFNQNLRGILEGLKQFYQLLLQGIQ